MTDTKKVRELMKKVHKAHKLADGPEILVLLDYTRRLTNEVEKLRRKQQRKTVPGALLI